MEANQKHLKNISKCKCKFDGRKCNSRFSNNKCWCECKNFLNFCLEAGYMYLFAKMVNILEVLLGIQ